MSGAASFLPPGAPQLLNPALGLIGNIGLATAADFLGLNSEAVLGAWSISEASGATVLTFQSVVSLHFEGDYSICNYPIEDGSFASYNKVVEPFSVKMVVSLGNSGASALLGGALTLLSGNPAGALSALNGTTARATFLDQLEEARASTTPLGVVTPDRIYTPITITHVDYDRTASRGAKLLQVEIWFEQIITTAATLFSNVQSPNSFDAVNDGVVQSQPLPPLVSGAVAATGAN